MTLSSGQYPPPEMLVRDVRALQSEPGRVRQVIEQIPELLPTLRDLMSTVPATLNESAVDLSVIGVDGYRRHVDQVGDGTLLWYLSDGAASRFWVDDDEHAVTPAVGLWVAFSHGIEHAADSSSTVRHAIVASYWSDR